VDRKPQLLDIRQIGPDSEKDISGKCSACGDYLLAGLDESEKPNPERLRKALEETFVRHIAARHAHARTRTALATVTPFG
jgi:hypothetical protein